MGDYFTIGILIVVGLVLIVIEVLFIPGTTFVGIIGFILGTVGIVLSFNKSETIGWIVTGGAAAISMLTFYISFRKNVWQRFALNSQLIGNVHGDEKVSLQIGEMGKTISALRPSGTAEFHNQYIEVQTFGQFLDAGTIVRIVQLDNRKVFVEKIEEA